eukprot:TRINITY_DN10777_c0_g2_i3.p1 TRINITY_DN10777_c0_g2~~TRINITY_DN10777_c0_g2_i3.p1  ORF type:complete len:954 (+),score=43.96 TRINITY_DN10777_c0_g2_i3:56-2863(+)
MTNRRNSMRPVAELKGELREFQKQREAERTKRYRIVVRVGWRIMTAGLLLHIVSNMPPRVFDLLLGTFWRLGLSSAAVVLASASGLDLDDYLHRRHVARKCGWFAIFLYSAQRMIQPYPGVATRLLRPTTPVHALATCVACWAMCSRTQLARRSVTNIVVVWCVCNLAAQSLWFGVQGFGCKLVDLPMSTVPAGFPLLVILFAQCCRRLLPSLTNAQEERWLWPATSAVFWILYYQLYNGVGEFYLGVLMWFRLECMSFEEREWYQVCLLGFCYMFPHLVLILTGRVRLHGLLTRLNPRLETASGATWFASVLGVTCFFVISLQVLLGIVPEDGEAGVTGTLSRFLMVSGLVILSTCPPEDVDIDEAVRERPALQVCLGLAAAMYCLQNLLQYSLYLYAAPALTSLQVALSSRRCLGNYLFVCSPGVATLWCMTLAVKLFADASWALAISEGCRRFDLAAATTYIFAASVIAICLLRWLWCPRLKSSRCNGGDRLPPTLALYITLYIFYTTWGFVAFGRGVFKLLGCPEQPTYPCVIDMAFGVADAAPIFLVLTIGKKRLFNFTARNFDRDRSRARRDGAFLASLLDSASRVEVGNSCWIHHARNDARYAWHDHRRNWDLGKVVSVNTDFFMVRTEEIDEAAESSTIRLSKLSAATAETITSIFSYCKSVSGRSETSATSWVSRVSKKTRRKRSGQLHTVPMAGRGMSVEEMLALAQKELRCIDWHNITRELMTGAICDHDAADISTLYELSRPVRPGEMIDYFMSHSWHDGVEVKFARLERIVAEFELQHHRSPTFWLDKVCIDQRCLADGLRVLPVNVMACKRVLVLCGPTYPDRLWCIWEMCVVLSFVSPEQALERLRFEVLAPDALERLQHFEVANARCYDPNEQVKLLQVINTIGAERFAEQIRQLALALQPEPRHSDASSTALHLLWLC